jgi:hypothetical protein
LFFNQGSHKKKEVIFAHENLRNAAPGKRTSHVFIFILLRM